MLKPNLAADAVLVAEAEEVQVDHPHHRFDLAVGDGNRPNGAGLAVRHIEGVSVAGQATGLSKTGLVQGTVVDELSAAARIGVEPAFVQIEGPNLMAAGLGDEEPFAQQIKIPGAIQAGLER